MCMLEARAFIISAGERCKSGGDAIASHCSTTYPLILPLDKLVVSEACSSFDIVCFEWTDACKVSSLPVNLAAFFSAMAWHWVGMHLKAGSVYIIRAPGRFLDSASENRDGMIPCGQFPDAVDFSSLRASLRVFARCINTFMIFYICPSLPPILSDR